MIFTLVSFQKPSLKTQKKLKLNILSSTKHWGNFLLFIIVIAVKGGDLY